MNFIRQIYSIIALTFAWNGTALFGGTSPQTNTLVAEIKIVPPEIEVDGLFGQFVAAKSNLVVVSYRNAPERGTNTPVAAVFKKSGIGFEQQQALLVVPTSANFSVQDLATDGNEVALLGTEGNISTIYIFSKLQEEWILETRLVPSETIWSISISDHVIVAGAAMKALVFEFRENSWTETIILPPETAPAVVKNGFGATAAVDQGTILVGAVGEVRGDPGRAYAFIRADDNWLLQAELQPDDFIYALFGSAVAIDGDTVLVSVAPSHYNSGMVFVFERSGGAWTRKGPLLPESSQENFGRSLAISGRNIVVGAPLARAGAGCVYLFREDGAGFDRLKLYRDDMISGDSMGNDVTADGNSIFFGAPFHDGFAQNGGVAFLFDFEFRLTMGSVWARAEDNSFHFTIADAKIGENYTIETSAAFGTDWIPLKQLVADRPTIQTEVDIPSGAFGFFRISDSANAQPQLTRTLFRAGRQRVATATKRISDKSPLAVCRDTAWATHP